MKTAFWNECQPFPSKVNFVDSNNVLLGYDMHQCCCEHAYWFISKDRCGHGKLIESDKVGREAGCIDGFVFDPDFYEEDHPEDYSESFYEGGAVVFKLVGVKPSAWNGLTKQAVRYLHLVNIHNGYYGHGFTFRGAETIEGCL